MSAVFQVRDNEGRFLTFTDQDTTIRLIAARRVYIYSKSEMTFTHDDPFIEPGKVFLIGGMAQMPDTGNVDSDNLSFDAVLKDDWTVEDGRVTFTCDNNSYQNYPFFVYIYSRT